jgi:uncharacterized protein YndB with AHSA1/START domain
MDNFRAAVLAISLVASAPALAASPVHDTSFKEANGDRVLQQSAEIAAPAHCLWQSLTDEETLKGHGVPLVHVDLRNGGTIEEGFSATAKLGADETIRHQIVAYLPERLLILRNQATPPGPPHAELYRNIVQVITLEPQKGGTRLTISHTGYGASPDYDQLYAFFHNINDNFLKGVKTFCEKKS